MINRMYPAFNRRSLYKISFPVVTFPFYSSIVEVTQIDVSANISLDTLICQYINISIFLYCLLNILVIVQISLNDSIDSTNMTIIKSGGYYRGSKYRIAYRSWKNSIKHSIYKI